MVKAKEKLIFMTNIKEQKDLGENTAKCKNG